MSRLQQPQQGSSFLVSTESDIQASYGMLCGAVIYPTILSAIASAYSCVLEAPSVVP